MNFQLSWSSLVLTLQTSVSKFIPPHPLTSHQYCAAICLGLFVAQGLFLGSKFILKDLEHSVM